MEVNVKVWKGKKQSCIKYNTLWYGTLEKKRSMTIGTDTLMISVNSQFESDLTHACTTKNEDDWCTWFFFQVNLKKENICI